MYLWLFWFITPDFRFVSKYILTQGTIFYIEFTESHNTALCSKITLNTGLYKPYRRMFCMKNKGKGCPVTCKAGTEGR